MMTDKKKAIALILAVVAVLAAVTLLCALAWAKNAPEPVNPAEKTYKSETAGELAAALCITAASGSVVIYTGLRRDKKEARKPEQAEQI